MEVLDDQKPDENKELVDKFKKVIDEKFLSLSEKLNVKEEKDGTKKISKIREDLKEDYDNAFRYIDLLEKAGKSTTKKEQEGIALYIEDEIEWMEENFDTGMSLIENPLDEIEDSLEEEGSLNKIINSDPRIKEGEITIIRHRLRLFGLAYLVATLRYGTENDYLDASDILEQTINVDNRQAHKIREDISNNLNAIEKIIEPIKVEYIKLSRSIESLQDDSPNIKTKEVKRKCQELTLKIEALEEEKADAVMECMVFREKLKIAAKKFYDLIGAN